MLEVTLQLSGSVCVQRARRLLDVDTIHGSSLLSPRSFFADCGDAHWSVFLCFFIGRFCSWRNARLRIRWLWRLFFG